MVGLHLSTFNDTNKAKVESLSAEWSFLGTLWTLEIKTTCIDKSVSLVYYLHTQNPPKSQYMYIA